VVKGYRMDSVVVLEDADVKVRVDARKKRYVVEAALPWSVLGVRPAPGMALKTHVAPASPSDVRHFSSSFVRRSTISGRSSKRFFCSAGSWPRW